MNLEHKTQQCCSWHNYNKSNIIFTRNMLSSRHGEIVALGIKKFALYFGQFYIYRMHAHIKWFHCLDRTIAWLSRMCVRFYYIFCIFILQFCSLMKSWVCTNAPAIWSKFICLFCCRPGSRIVIFFFIYRSSVSLCNIYFLFLLYWIFDPQI